MEMLLWVCNAMSRRFKSGSVSIYMADMVALNEDFKMTQESMELSQGQDVQKLKGKGSNKEKGHRTIMYYLHLSIMAISYVTFIL
jgi:hypothetical protein